MARAQRTVAYYLSLDMAKELAMVERNEKGKQARQYFIDCERLAKAAPAEMHTALSNPAALRAALLSYTERVIELQAKVEVLDPKADALERIAAADGSLCITDAAKTLQIRPKLLFDWLSGNLWIYRRAGGHGWLAYQSRIQQGLLTHKIVTVQREDGTDKVVESVRVTPKGLARLSEVFEAVAA